MTEIGGRRHVNLSWHNKLGTIGATLPGAETSIGPDGEILVSGPQCIQGLLEQSGKNSRDYHAATAGCETGDVGQVDNEGFFTITGRLKDIIITAGGKNITPGRNREAR